MALVVGNIVGVGIFTTSGLIAAELGLTPWLLGIWVLGGLLAAIGAVCYSVLAAQIPREGGEYAFLFARFGPLPAFLSGWASLWIGFSAPLAAGALGLAHYLNPLLGWHAQPTPLMEKLLAVAVLGVLTLLLSLGLRFGARLHLAITLLNLGLLCGLVWVVLQRSTGGNHLRPLLQTSAFQIDPWALGSALVLVMFAYSGWNAAVYVAEEVGSPTRNIPLALMLGTGIVMVLYLLVNVAYFASTPVSVLKGEIAVANLAAVAVLGRGGTNLVNLAVLLSITSSLTAMAIAGPRVYFAMARDGLFPGWLAVVDRRRKLSLRATWFQTAVALVLVSIGNLYQILLYSGMVLIFFSGLTVATLFLVEPDVSGRVQSWIAYRLLPSVFLLISLLVLASAALAHPYEAAAGALTLSAGLPFYRYYSRRRLTGGLPGG